MRHIKPSLLGIVAVALPIVLVNQREARADLQASYSTNGTFDVDSQSGSTITLSNGNLTIQVTYVGMSQTTVTVPDTTAPFGYFTVTAENQGSANLNTKGTFDLMIAQSGPLGGSAEITSSVSGSISLGTSNDLTFQFGSPPDPITIGQISYALPNSIVLPSPLKATGASTTTYLTANITDPPLPTPEPSTLMTVAIGAAMLAGYAWRRDRRTSVGATDTSKP